MREIKFRLWDKESKYWAYDSDDGNMDYMMWLDGQIYWDGNPIKDFDKKYVLMQFIGLKDKNGKEIYEGDIFKEGYYDENKPILYIVEWREKDASFGWKQIVPVLTEGFEIKDVEVIGNIYENPNLLTSAKQKETNSS